MMQGPEWHGTVDQINWRPRAFRLKKFLTPAECDFLIEKVSSISLSKALQACVQYYCSMSA